VIIRLLLIFAIISIDIYSKRLIFRVLVSKTRNIKRFEYGVRNPGEFILGLDKETIRRLMEESDSEVVSIAR